VGVFLTVWGGFVVGVGVGCGFWIVGMVADEGAG